MASYWWVANYGYGYPLERNSLYPYVGNRFVASHRWVANHRYGFPLERNIPVSHRYGFFFKDDPVAAVGVEIIS